MQVFMRLEKIPSFGFEDENWSAYGVHEENARKALAGKSNFHNRLTLSEAEKRSRMMHNARKVFEYIPVIGIFFGLFGLLEFATKEGREQLSIHFVERHLIAVVGLGFLLPPIDLIAGCAKNREVRSL
ncbi:hypothetical protein PHSC3_001750 [Chlamydiales bacterium STE3]|nr:hypothetical protein PHSC3_001750 [Chlamydiales bacterium STE3]